MPLTNRYQIAPGTVNRVGRQCGKTHMKRPLWGRGEMAERLNAAALKLAQRYELALTPGR